MITNALSPMRVIETLGELIDPNGTIAIMSSGQASIANNERGGFEITEPAKRPSRSRLGCDRAPPGRDLRRGPATGRRAAVPGRALTRAALEQSFTQSSRNRPR
jgi:hypothetical protein